MGQRFSENKRETLERVDSQIAELHKQRKSTFYASLSLEFMARILGCLEVYFILNILTTDVSFPACILIMAFTSLFANLFFFSPMQLGAREGGFALAVGGLAIPGAFGVYTGLITRVRELIWIVIGVLLMKSATVHLLIKHEIMNALKDIQGVIFDYGGTIDTNSVTGRKYCGPSMWNIRFRWIRRVFVRHTSLEKERWLNTFVQLGMIS